MVVDKQFNRMVIHYRLNCRAVQSMQLEGDFYLGAPFQMHLPTPVEIQEWITAPPQSINETLVIRGCLIARGKPTEPVK
jgi:hypothetical protein